MTGAAKKVAVIGAGPSGLAAAWALSTPRPDGIDPAEVTIYERAWRPGGKCANSRVGTEHRIVQNGTHYIFGVYFNSLNLIQDAFAELGAAGQVWGGVGELVGRDRVAFKHWFDGAWTNWTFPVPQKGAMFSGTKDPFDTSPATLFPAVLNWLLEQLGVLNILGGPTPSIPDVLGDAIDEFIRKAITWAEQFASKPDNAVFLILLKTFLKSARVGVLELLNGNAIEIVRARMLVDLVLTTLCGILEDKLLVAGNIDALDNQDFAQWLALHGAQPETTSCPLVRAWYDSVAAYENGDTGKPSVSAASVLQSVVPALLLYQGAFAYQMKPEVGECFIGPVYAALAARGVKFRFMHELTEITPNSAGTEIQSLTFSIPKLAMGNSETELANYKPVATYSVGGVQRAFWPPKPNAPFEFVGEITPQNPLALRACGPARELVNKELGTDFDTVLLTVPHSVVRHIGPQLITQKPAWKQLTDKLPSVETKSLRLWVKEPLPNYKWDPVHGDKTPILSAYRPHFSTWEDSSQQLSLHTWPTDPPQSIATVFGPFKSLMNHPPQSQLAEWLYNWIAGYFARKHAREFTDNETTDLWPGLVNAGNFRYDQLRPAGSLADPLYEQWIVANAIARERYTHAAPGTFHVRLRSGDTDYNNLSVAGEWTKFWPATANVELAVISGIRAGYDVRGIPDQIPSEGGFFKSA